MTTRITGLVSGLDVDALVEAGASFYQNKLDEAKQKQQKLQWEQTAYKSVATDVTTFYNKYLDVLSDDSITKSSNWNTNSYTSSNSSAVTAQEIGSTNVANYTANVTQLATAAKAEVSTNVLKPNNASQIIINGQTYTLNSADANNNAIVSDLNSQLSAAGQAVTVSYSDFANNGTSGFIIQNNVNGDKSLTVSSASAGSGDITLTKGTYLNATITCGSNTYTIDDSKAVANNNITLDNVKFTFNDVTSPVTNSTLATSNVSTVVNSDGTKIITDGTTTTLYFKSDGTIDTSKTNTINGTTLNNITYANGIISGTDGGNTTLSFNTNNNCITTSDGTTNTTTTQYGGTKVVVNNDGSKTISTSDNNTVINIDKDGNIVNTSKINGISVSSGTVTNTNGILNITGTDSSKNALSFNLNTNTGATTLSTITGGLTTTTRFYNDGSATKSTQTSNTPASITGSTDVSDIQDKIESFINDYNTLISEINTQYYTSYDNDYQPLTDAEKKAMSDSDISAWNVKAQTGLLYGDDNLDKLSSQMKDAMSTFMKSSGVDLESFGITPVDDYTTKNGTYTIDSDKLKTALEDPTKFSKIQSLFCDGITNITSLSTSNSNTDGIAARLKVALNINVTTPSSVFSELCGTDNNPGSLTTNEFYKELQDQSDYITQYQNELSDKENALYSKYSQLESQLTELQSSSSVFSSSSN